MGRLRRSSTKLMRLPENFEQDIMAYAQLLDAGKTVKLVMRMKRGKPFLKTSRNGHKTFS